MFLKPKKMVKDKDKKKKRQPTVMRRTAIKFWLANGGKKSVAMRAAGFAESMARNPQKVFKPEVYAQILSRNGLDDETLSQIHSRLAHASILRERDFHSSLVYSKSKTMIEEVPDEVIQRIIESSPGCELISIIKYKEKKVAYYRSPEHVAQKQSIELAYKSKGLMAPEKHEVEVSHEPTAAEKEIIKEIFNSNKS